MSNFDQIFIMLAIPGIDMLRLSIERLLKGKSIFTPDNNHIHHIMLNNLEFVAVSIVMNSFFIIIFVMLFLNISSYYILYLIILFYSSILIQARLSSKGK